jgi:hypothetical protein
MTTHRKNPAAVKLGRMTSERKAEAARRNGSLGGAPKSRYQIARKQSDYPVIWQVVEALPGMMRTHGGYAVRKEAVAMLRALRERERNEH